MTPDVMWKPGAPLNFFLFFRGAFAAVGMPSPPMHLPISASPSGFGGEQERVLHWIEYFNEVM